MIEARSASETSCGGSCGGACEGCSQESAPFQSEPSVGRVSLQAALQWGNMVVASNPGMPEFWKQVTVSDIVQRSTGTSLGAWQHDLTQARERVGSLFLPSRASVRQAFRDLVDFVQDNRERILSSAEVAAFTTSLRFSPPASPAEFIERAENYLMAPGGGGGDLALASASGDEWNMGCLIIGLSSTACIDSTGVCTAAVGHCERIGSGDNCVCVKDGLSMWVKVLLAILIALLIAALLVLAWEVLLPLISEALAAGEIGAAIEAVEAAMAAAGAAA